MPWPTAEEIIVIAIRDGWKCDYCGTILTPDNIEHHDGKSEVTAHRTCFAQSENRKEELGGAWADGWKPIPPMKGR